MFKGLKDAWRDARKKVEEEDKARAAAAAKAAPPAIPFYFTGTGKTLELS